MSAAFMHIGKFVVAPDHADRFVDLMRDYEQFATQNGLDHSHIVEDETSEGTFMHVTVWATREDWEAIEKTDAHQRMHAGRDTLLAAPMEHDFLCAKVL
ncbi:MAG: antibiotic biosynthesis monooxygenase family protein [Pseudomonadota bacterium]